MILSGSGETVATMLETQHILRGDLRSSIPRLPA